MTLDMQGRVAVVTGASSGIGRATALLLARAGAAVTLVARPGDELEDTAQECRELGAKAPMLQAEYRAAADPAAARTAGEQSIALGRLGRPENVAPLALFLLSDDAAYVTGGHYVVDGGRTNCFPAESSASSQPHIRGDTRTL